MRLLVVANTDTTVTVAGDVSGLAVVGPPGYAFKDYHIRIDSDAIDAARPSGYPGLRDLKADASRQ